MWKWIQDNTLLFFKIVTAVAAIIIALMMLSRCSDRSKDLTAQIEQSNRSIEAFADATEDAVARIDDRFATERDVDNAVEQVKDKIGNAQTVDDIRDAVLISLCRKPSHRDDPACTVRSPDSG